MKRSFLILSMLIFSFNVGGCLEGADSMLKVGSLAPSLQTRTLKDVDGDMSRMTSYRYPDARMYQYSLDDALTLNKTVLVEFATPGHCTVCDKQLQMLKAMISKYYDDVVFLHMDQYKNPQAFITYNVKGDPWTFILDNRGIVQFKQSGRILYGELDYHLKKITKISDENRKADIDAVAASGAVSAKS